MESVRTAVRQLLMVIRQSVAGTLVWCVQHAVGLRVIKLVKEEEMDNTFNGWKLKGRVVRRGERGLYRNEYGDYMFSREQTDRLGPVEQITVYRDSRGRFVRSTTVIR